MPAKLKHGMEGTPTYKSWQSLKQRCLNPKNDSYKYYGGRGIKISPRWLDFVNFYTDMGPRPGRAYSIERRNTDKDYTPGNCYWATAKEQGRNKRNNVCYTFRGMTKCLSAWAEFLEIPRPCLNVRLSRGWSIERAFTTKVAVRVRKC